MITERFNHLRQEKKFNIFLGIKRVLTKKPYENIITTDLIEETGISRGSFYSYFDDKRDAVQALCIEESRKTVEMLKELIMENEGDYFKAVKSAYEKLKDDVNLIYAEKVIANFSFINDILIELLNKSSAMPIILEFNEWCAKYSFNDYYKLNIGVEEVEHINMLCLQVVTNALTQVLRAKKNNSDIEKVNKGFDIEINIIRNGVLSHE